MRHLALLATALLAASSAHAQTGPGPGPACLAPVTAADGPVAIRDAKFLVYETSVPGAGPQSRQTIVQLQACAALAGTATAYVLSYRPVLFSADGHLLQGGNLVNGLKILADDPKGGPAHIVISDGFSIGYTIDHTKLARSIVITALTAGPCTATAGGACAALPPDTPVRTITVPVCLADGTVPPPAECPAAAAK